MNSIEKLASYRKALERWVSKKRIWETSQGKTGFKPLKDLEPTLKQFEIAEDDQCALKIREQVVNKPAWTPPQPLEVKRPGIPKRKLGIPKRKPMDKNDENFPPF